MAEGLLDKANIILTPTGYKAGTMYNVAPIEQPYEDFVFSRASVASRVNSSGLVEMVGRTLGSNLVQNGDFSDIGPDLVQNGTFDLGSELVTNGDFATDSDWIKGVGWSIADGKASCDGTQTGNSGLQQSGIASIGNVYKIQFDLTVTSGFINYVNLGGWIDGTNLTTSGTYTYYTDTTTATDNLGIAAASNFIGSIDNVSVKEVPDWSLGAKWSVEDNYARLISTTSAGSSLIQSNVFTVGKSYKITLDAIVTSGSAKLEGSGGSEVLRIDTTQSYTLYWTADITDIIFNRRSYTSDVKITNIVVQELDPNDYWNLGTGWSIGDDEATSDGTQSSNTNLQSSTFDFSVDTKVTLSFDVVNYSSGNLAASVTGTGQADLTNINSNGTYSVTVVSSAGSRYVDFTADANFVGSITNVTAQEIIDTNNIPRINYDSNGENGHWLLEPTSTNLVTYSEDFSQWLIFDTINRTSNYGTSPDGTQNSYKIGSSGGANDFIYLSLTITASQSHTLSFFIKNVDSTETRFRNASESSINIYWSGSTITSIDSGANYEAYGNGWYKITSTATSNSDGGFISRFYPSTSGTASVELYGYQLEALSYSTSYIPTLTGSTETRATETATGAGSADLINSTEGVLYAEISTLANDGTNRLISLSDGTADERVFLQYSSTDNRVQFLVKNNNTTQCNIIYDATDLTVLHKIAAKYKENDFALWVDGVEIGTDTSGTVASGLNQLQFDRGYSGLPFYGKCKALAVFNTALTDAELTELTS